MMILYILPLLIFSLAGIKEILESLSILENEHAGEPTGTIVIVSILLVILGRKAYSILPFGFSDSPGLILNKEGFIKNTEQHERGRLTNGKKSDLSDTVPPPQEQALLSVFI